MEAHTLLRNLNVVGRLLPHDKLMTESGAFVIQHPTASRALSRMWNGETRELNAERVHRSVHQAMYLVSRTLSEDRLVGELPDQGTTLLAQLHHADEMLQCERLLTALQALLGGLDSMCTTYRDDTSLCVRLRQIHDDANEFVQRMRALLGSGRAALRGPSRDGL